MTAIVVRAATVDDAAEIARVHIQAWRETYSRLVEPGELDELSVERRAARHREIIADARASVQVAELDGMLIGFVSSGTSRDREAMRPIELQALYVIAEHHGSGAGQALLDAAIGSDPAFLFVADRNPRATRFYQRNGFVFDGAEDSHPLVRTPIRSLRMVR